MQPQSPPPTQPTTTTTTVSISMAVTLRGDAHRAFTSHPDEVIAALRESLIGDADAATADDTIILRSLKIKTRQQ